MKELEELERIVTKAHVMLTEKDWSQKTWNEFTLKATPEAILSLIRELKITRHALDDACGYGAWVKRCLRKSEVDLYPETEQP